MSRYAVGRRFALEDWRCAPGSLAIVVAIVIAIVVAIAVVGDATIAVPVLRRSAGANLARGRVVGARSHETSRERADKCRYQKQAGRSEEHTPQLQSRLHLVCH